MIKKGIFFLLLSFHLQASHPLWLEKFSEIEDGGDLTPLVGENFNQVSLVDSLRIVRPKFSSSETRKKPMRIFLLERARSLLFPSHIRIMKSHPLFVRSFYFNVNFLLKKK
jgi:hypothetical protein